jgi:hypothetical protein
MTSKALPREARSVFKNDAGFSGGGESPASAWVAGIAEVLNDNPFRDRVTWKYRSFATRKSLERGANEIPGVGRLCSHRRVAA